MKSKAKEKLKKLGGVLVRGVKKGSAAVKKYGPTVHAHARAISESTMEMMTPDVDGKPRNNLIPRRRRGYVDMTAKKKPKKVQGNKKGFYLDFT